MTGDGAAALNAIGLKQFRIRGLYWGYMNGCRR